MEKISQRKIARLLIESDSAVSITVVVLGFLVGTLLVLLTGRDPLNMYKALLQAMTGVSQNLRGVWRWNPRYIGEWLNYSSPYILCGLSMAFAARAGLFNIGGEGQFIAGMTAATLVALISPALPALHWLPAVLAAVIIGAAWGGIAGFLKAKFEVSEVVATIMMNYIALYLSRIIILNVPGADSRRTPDFPESALLNTEFLSRLTGGSHLNLGLFITIIAVFIYLLLMEKSKTGFALRATGFNREAARASGIPVSACIVASMCFAGAFAALGGSIVALGSFRYGRVLTGMENYGFTGIAVALVGNSKAGGTAAAGLLFGLLAASAPIMQDNRIPVEVIFIIQGVIVVFIALREGFRMFLRRKYA
ncbi:MAG: ABC transporter permease [Spirochaetaceae bacterium]|jgi:simple sugar transport system permease protein|nr:ABC transporter permease [Spirochaetaceae bacterium]